MRPVVDRVDDDGLVGDVQLIQQVEQLSDLAVMFDHAVGEDPETGHALALGLEVRVEMHARGGDPGEPGFPGRMVLLDELGAAVEELLVGRLHAFLGQRPGVDAILLAHRAEARVGLATVGIGRNAIEQAARAELRAEGRILRIIGVFRLFLGVEVIEVAVELVEAVHGGQEIVAVAEMVLAELAARVPVVLEEIR